MGRFLVTMCLLNAQSGCDVKEELTPKHRNSSDESSAATEPEQTHLPSDTGSTTAPSTIPDAYFGRTPFRQLDSPVDIEPLENGSVVLIIFDALNAKHLGTYGYARPTSPNVDAIAREGLLFRNHVSNSSWTRPSFTTIITGLSKAEHGVELKGGWRLEPPIKTLAERFRKAGYRTACFTGNSLVRKSWGFDQGFQVFEDPITLGLKAFPRDKVLINSALKWLASIRDKPFFLVLFLTSSHPPYRPPLRPRQFLSTVPAGEIIEHPFKEYKKPLPLSDHQRIVAAYDDEIAYMDGQVGRLIEYLNSSKKFRRSIVAITADHGEIFGNHNCYLHAYHMWEPVLRVPFILKAPNISLAGVREDRPSTHVDIAPTLLDLVGLEYSSSELNGISLLRYFEDLSLGRKRILFSQYNAHGVRRQAIRRGQFKLVHHHQVQIRAAKELDELHPGVRQPDPRDLPTLAWDDERFEFYNILIDPNEVNDLYSRQPSKSEIEELKNALQPFIEGRNTVGEMTEEMVKALENAGYLRVSDQTSTTPRLK